MHSADYDLLCIERAVGLRTHRELKHAAALAHTDHSLAIVSKQVLVAVAEAVRTVDQAGTHIARRIDAPINFLSITGRQPPEGDAPVALNARDGGATIRDAR
eukprot:CAMPEP_0174696622 /NCGR_PEP_ID=MMETSP1094-20130205/2723_1 /TAXON_ID=156173 /ORGANISM="Chrysochromulina brevifilum, Strain UTEX LB 985" /LENGTH=101 /DNA_ID=CAMNT_0015893441 /DNA_START=420 /DNA_END=725 /DNA_ORIENTATION=+